MHQDFLQTMDSPHLADPDPGGGRNNHLKKLFSVYFDDSPWHKYYAICFEGFSERYFLLLQQYNLHESEMNNLINNN